MNKISPSTGSPIDAVRSVPEEPVADSAEVPAESDAAEQRSQTAADGAREKSIDAAQAKAAAGQKQTLQDAVKGLPGFIDGPTPGTRRSTQNDVGQAIQRGAKTVSRDVEGPASTGTPNQPQIGEPVLVADNTRKAAPYPVSNDAIDTGLRRSDRFLKQLPEWTMNDKRAFLMRLEPGKGGILDPIFELRIPSDGEIANHPLTRKFDAATRGATALLNQAKDFYGMAKDFLAAGDRTSAQQYFDQARALEHRATHFVYRNEQWLNLRREHVGQALDKHWEDLKEMAFADVSALGADAYVFGKAFGALTKCYKAGVRGAITNLGLAKVAGKGETIVKTARLERLEQVLADPATLSKMKPQELVELSGGLKFGSSLTTDEAEALIKTAANRPEFQIARAEAIADDVISWMRPDGNKFETFMRPEDQNELRVLLTDDSKMVKMTPQELLAKAGGAITEDEAKTLISAADLRLNREIDNLSWEKAITALNARGDKEAAQELGDFMKGLEAHQRLVGVMGDEMSHAVIPKLRSSSVAELQAKYGLTEAEATALKMDLKGLPDKFSFYQHDLWGPAGKNKTSIARALGRNAPKGDPVVGYAHYRHNLQFGHHRFNDPLSRLEAALDKVDAMRDTTRAYREFQPMDWAEIDKELGNINDPALRAWAKLSKQHIKTWEEAGELPRMVPTDTPRFKTGNRIDV